MFTWPHAKYLLGDCQKRLHNYIIKLFSNNSTFNLGPCVLGIKGGERGARHDQRKGGGAPCVNIPFPCVLHVLLQSPLSFPFCSFYRKDSKFKEIKGAVCNEAVCKKVELFYTVEFTGDVDL